MILKGIRDPVRVEVKKVVSYTVTYGKIFCWQDEKTQWKKKETEMKGGKNENICTLY